MSREKNLIRIKAQVRPSNTCTATTCLPSQINYMLMLTLPNKLEVFQFHLKSKFNTNQKQQKEEYICCVCAQE